MNIRKDELESNLNYEKMCLVVSKNHATNSKNQKYGIGEVCCQVEAGFHFCCGTSKYSDFEKFGVGISLYFKFIKYLICFFFIFVIISLPILYLNIEGI